MSPQKGRAPPIDPFTGENPEVLLEDWPPCLARASQWNGWTESEEVIQLAGHLGGALVELENDVKLVRKMAGYTGTFRSRQQSTSCPTHRPESQSESIWSIHSGLLIGKIEKPRTPSCMV